MRRPRRRSALRLAARVALFALIGAAATVLVAWGCDFAVPGGRPKLHWTTESRWPVAVNDSWPERPAVMFWREEVGWRRASWRAKRDHGDWNDGPWEHSIWIVRSGLPLASFASFDQTVHHRRGVVSTRRWGFFNAPIFKRVLPAMPLWPGFAVDTVFYGGLAFVVWGAPGLVRRRVRRRRGRCVACGYDLSGAGGGGVCPECGEGGA